jgi:phosphoribosyl-ATP pyrophosphohydrolase
MTHPLDQLYQTIAARRSADPGTSYTAQLLCAGPERCAKKFGEEAVETVIAAAAGKQGEVVTESADVLYHLLVLWAACGVEPDRVWQALAARQGRSGLEEKASRALPKTREPVIGTEARPNIEVDHLNDSVKP